MAYMNVSMLKGNGTYGAVKSKNAKGTRLQLVVIILNNGVLCSLGSLSSDR